MFDEHEQEERRNGVKEAAKIAWRILRDQGTALQAVEAAVVSLEDNPWYNAGKEAYNMLSLAFYHYPIACYY